MKKSTKTADSAGVLSMGTNKATTSLAFLEPRSVSTVDDKMSPTLDTPHLVKILGPDGFESFDMNELADEVIKGVKDFAEVLPQIVRLKRYFDTADRDSTNRLRVPIKGCRTWLEFCETHIRKIQRMLSDSTKKPKASSLPAAQVTEEDFARYNQEHPAVQKFTQKLLAQLSPDDAASALVNTFETDKPPMSKLMADALVRVARGEKLEVAASAGDSDIFDRLWKKVTVLRPFTGDGEEHVFVQLALDAQQTPITNKDQYMVVKLTVSALREASEKFLEYAQGLEKVLENSPIELKADDVILASLENIG